MATQLPLFVDHSTGSVKEVATGDVVAPAALGTGTSIASKFLRGDSTWATPAGGAGGSEPTVSDWML